MVYVQPQARGPLHLRLRGSEVLCELRTSQSVWDGVGVLAQVVLVEALRVALSEQPGDLLLQHRPHCLRQIRALAHCSAIRGGAQ